MYFETAKLNCKKWKKSSLYKEKSLVGLTPDCCFSSKKGINKNCFVKLTMTDRWIDCPLRDLLQSGGEKAKQLFLAGFGQKTEAYFIVINFSRKSCKIRRSLTQPRFHFNDL
jgi:hypothetical protein